jgi:II/X family phage/plasmid replication protein
MIDKLRIQIPFKHDFVTANDDFSSGIVDLRVCQKYGCRLQSGSIEFKHYDKRLDPTATMIAEVSDLRHPYESLASSWSTLSFKIFSGSSTYYPYIEIKASPAKLLQGHNVFGSCDVELCIESLVTTFQYALPEFSDLLEWHLAELQEIDCTYTAHMPDETTARNVLKALQNVSNGQTRNSQSAFDTTVYFGKGSRHKRLKVYLKIAELLGQINELEKSFEKTKNKNVLRQLNAMKDEKVKSFAALALRFEATILKRKFVNCGIPTNLWQFEKYAKNFKGCLVKTLWEQSFSDIFKTFEGEKMVNFNDDEVHTKLKQKFFTLTKSGKTTYSKADRLFRFFRSIKNEGFSEVKETTPEKTFYRNLKELTSVVPKAYLQNVQSIASNVVPLIRFIDVDFTKQHPENWQEPTPLYKQLEAELTQLRAVS